MFPFYIKLAIYINLLFIFLISLYVIFSSSKGKENSLDETYSKTYKLSSKNL